MVQVCHESQWGLVCDHDESWTTRSAVVVCRQVGMGYRGQVVNMFTELITLLKTTDARPIQRQKLFYDGTVILDNINCIGSENSLTDCPGGSIYGNFDDCLYIAVAFCEGKY